MLEIWTVLNNFIDYKKSCMFPIVWLTTRSVGIKTFRDWFECLFLFRCYEGEGCGPIEHRAAAKNRNQLMALRHLSAEIAFKVLSFDLPSPWPSPILILVVYTAHRIWLSLVIFLLPSSTAKSGKSRNTEEKCAKRAWNGITVLLENHLKCAQRNIYYKYFKQQILLKPIINSSSVL